MTSPVYSSRQCETMQHQIQQGCVSTSGLRLLALGRSTCRHQVFAAGQTYSELLQITSRKQQARLIAKIGQEWHASSSLTLIAHTHAPLDFFPTSVPLQAVDRYSEKYTGVLDVQQPNAFLLSLTNSIPKVSSRNFVIFLAEARRSKGEGKESNGR